MESVAEAPVTMPAVPPSLGTKAPRATLARFVRHLLPSWSGCGLVALGLLVLAVGLVVSLLFGLSTQDAQGRRSGSAGLMLLSVVVVPVVVLFTLLGALFSRRSGARGLLLLGTALILLVGNLSCGRAMISLGATGPQAWVLSTVLYGGLALLLGVAGLLLLGLTPRDVREGLDRERREYVHALLRSRGRLATAELAQALDVPEEVVRQHLVDLVADGELTLRVEDRAGRVYTADRARDLMHRLAATIPERGRVGIADLAGELGEPAVLVEGWIGELMMAGRLVGTIDRERDLVVWDPRGDGHVGTREFRERDCERCGGALRAVGGGLFRCVYCASELDVEDQSDDR